MSDVTLTAEQRNVLDTCPPRSEQPGRKGQLVRVTAAAGAGKTTTLLALAKQAAQLGYHDICYVTYTKAAANDGNERLGKTFAEFGITHVHVDTRTLHSLAQRLLNKRLDNQLDEDGFLLQAGPQATQLRNDNKVRAWIATQCKDPLDEFLEPCAAQIRRTKKGRFARRAIQRARDNVVFFIYKSLLHFCRSSWTLEEYTGTPVVFGRDYYPAQVFHEEGGGGHAQGFDPNVYERRVGFYAEQAASLWNIVVEQNIRSYDFEMKRVQLLQLRIPCSLLLVDESQDLDGCQVNWIGRQVEFGTHVYVVGDPAQAIFGFRGAKSQHLMDLPSDKDCSLTETRRFGQNIANLANHVLFAKEKSSQTGFGYKGKRKNWIPYRVKPGIRDKEAVVTTDSLLQQWRTKKITLIAAANATLLVKILAVLASVGPSQHVNVASLSPNDYEYPKVHINGRGEGSGLPKWKDALKMIGAVYGLYAVSKGGGDAQSLDESLFPEFAGRRVTWDEFESQCIELELSQYQSVISIVNKLGHQTMEEMEKFRKNVMEKQVPAEEADIILTTCHSAKGLEWDSVQVCDDFANLCRLELKRNDSQSRHYNSMPTKRTRTGSIWQFDVSWKDDVNLLYVAFTRAKSLLSVPSSLVSVLRFFDDIHEWKHAQDGSAFSTEVEVRVMDTTNKYRKHHDAPLTDEDAWAIFDQLVLPLRKELGLVRSDQLLTSSLLQSVTSVINDPDPPIPAVTPESFRAEDEQDEPGGGEYAKQLFP